MHAFTDKRFYAFALATLAVVACLFISANRWDNTLRDYQSYFTEIQQDDVKDAEPAPRIFLDNDAYYWISYAREMAASGTWRIRHTELDNPPLGRPVHWSQSVTWLLLAAGSLRRLFTGENLYSAIESAAVLIGPLQLIFLLIGTGFLIFRRLGLVPSLLWMFNLLAIPSVQWTFHPMRPDHHGLHLGFVVASLLCLILGGLGWTHQGPRVPSSFAMFRPLVVPGKREARGCFIASGFLGGLGIWTGATVQLFGVGLMAIGAMLLIVFMPAARFAEVGDRPKYEPHLWRVWAITGAATALCLYLVEYAPSFPGMRLEVNHPLYALSWLCIGEVLMRWSNAKRCGRPQSMVWSTTLLLGALLLPALLLFGPTHWHAMHDPMMQRLHQFIDEFRTYRQTFQTAPWSHGFGNFGLLPLFLIGAPLLAARQRTTLYERAACWVAFLPALIYAGLTLWQVRWMNFFAVSILLLAIITVAILWRQQNRDGDASDWLQIVVVLLFVQSAYFLFKQFRDLPYRDLSREPVGELIAPMLQRQFAEKLGEQNTNRAFRIMGGPHMAARLHYYGGPPSIASYYWENLEGLRSATEFFAAENDEQALRIVRDTGITHVVIPPSADFARMFYFIQHGRMNEQGARDSMTGRMLFQPEALPPWITRDIPLEKSLQPGYLFAGSPIMGALLVFTIQRDSWPTEAHKP
jgi:hypothetical protein